MRRALALAAALPLLLGAGACAGGTALRPAPTAPEPALSRAPGGEERLVARRARLELAAPEPAALAPAAEEVARAAGGEVESSLLREGRSLRMTLRVPTESLDPVLASLSALGEVRRREVSTQDVTEQTMDMEARLRSLSAVRDRLRQLLERAEGVRDVVEVERELGRVQGELDALQGRVDRLRGEARMAHVVLEVDRPRVLGPLGWLLAGAARLVSMLFVIR